MLTEIEQTLNIKPDDYDVIIAGDGSGSKYGWPGGWAAVLFDKDTNTRKIIYGSLSDTTVNVMELSPYIYALMWYANGRGKKLQQKIINTATVGIAVRPVNVHIVTDCAIIARQGNKEANRETNAPLWRSIDAFERLNYKITWHWLDRDILEVNRICDRLSKNMRLSLKDLVIPDVTEK